jgi:hypothetical protein
VPAICQFQAMRKPSKAPAERQQDDRRDREVDADRGAQVDRGAELALIERAAGDAGERPDDREQAGQGDRRAVDPMPDDQGDARRAPPRRRASAAPTAARAASAT